MKKFWRDRSGPPPAHDQAVLVVRREGLVQPAIWQVQGGVGRFWDYDAEGELLDEDVIWWMPFPEPP